MAIIAAYPEWFDRSGNIVPRHLITEVAVVRSYTPTGNEVASWDASAGMDGSVRAYITGTKLTIVCDTLTDIPARMFFKFLALEKISGLSAVTTIGESAFVYTPKISSIDITPSKITSIGELAFRMSSAEDNLDLSGVPLDVVGDQATRHKRWSADGLAAVRAVAFPRTICLDVPNPESQYSYPDIPFGQYQGGYVSIATAGCSVLSLYHMWNAIYAGTEKQYDDFPTWFGETLNRDGRYPDEIIDASHISVAEQVQPLGWGYNGITLVKTAEQLEHITNELENGFPVWLRVQSPNTIGGIHACAVVGCDTATHKLAIVDSSVLDNRGVISWVAFEDIFAEGSSNTDWDAIYYLDFNQPVLAPGSSWFTQGGTNVTRSSITEIEIVNSYTASGSETASWDASAKQNGSVMAYVNGTKLTLAGNGDIAIWTNPDASYLFSDAGSNKFSNLVAINGAELLNTQRAQTFARLFAQASKLKTVDVGSWDTRHVEDMSGVFDRASALQTTNVANWDTSSCKTMLAMFQGASSLVSLDLSKWDVSKVTNMKCMFLNGIIPALTSIGDVSKWDTSSVEDMNSMFQMCGRLENVDVSTWDVSKVTNMRCIFDNCKSFRELDLSGWDTSLVTDIQHAFDKMYKLEKITIGSNFRFTDTSGNSCVLPAPSSDNIPLADGNWYDHDYNAYAPADVPSKVARTYYASKFIAAGDDDTMVFVKNGTLRQIAVALRHKNGKSDTMYPSDFAEEVLAL